MQREMFDEVGRATSQYAVTRKILMDCLITRGAVFYTSPKMYTACTQSIELKKSCVRTCYGARRLIVHMHAGYRGGAAHALEQPALLATEHTARRGADGAFLGVAEGCLRAESGG